MSCADAQILHYCLRPACLLCDGRFHSGLLSAHVSVAQMGSVRKAQFLDLIRFFFGPSACTDEHKRVCF